MWTDSVVDLVPLERRMETVDAEAQSLMGATDDSHLPSGKGGRTTPGPSGGVQKSQASPLSPTGKPATEGRVGHI